MSSPKAPDRFSRALDALRAQTDVELAQSAGYQDLVGVPPTPHPHPAQPPMERDRLLFIQFPPVYPYREAEPRRMLNLRMSSEATATLVIWWEVRSSGPVPHFPQRVTTRIPRTELCCCFLYLLFINGR